MFNSGTPFNMDAFRIIEFLGKGCFGEVFLVEVREDSSHNTFLAAMKSALLVNSSSLMREGMILSEFIGQKEIVQYFHREITVEGGGRRCYNLFMEYAPVGSLSDHIENCGRQLPEFAVRIYAGMLLRGLKAMHQKGVVHCDLKPDNILVFEPEDNDSDVFQLKIADFGLSKVAGEEKNRGFRDTWTFKFRGTPIYMSPESVHFGEIEPPLDIWSLGCVVLEMLTGIPPWEDVDTREGIMLQLGVKEATPSIPPCLSEICKDFLGKCFVRNPWERWTADMLLNHPFVDQEHQVSTPLSPSISVPSSPIDFLPLGCADSPATSLHSPSPGWCSVSSSSTNWPSNCRPYMPMPNLTCA